MIGIYSWTNKMTNQSYVGQSINIEQRKQQHLTAKDNYPIHVAMRVYGIDNFVFSVLEECTPEQLNTKETFWIQKLNSYQNGYNCNLGGNQYSVGETNPRTKLTNADVLTIRNRIFLAKEDIAEVYSDYKDYISYNRFWSLAHGDTWKNVDTSMITNLINNQGSKNPRAKLTEEDVIEIRKRKYLENERTIDIYQDYKNRISFSAFEKIALGSTWKHIPIPNKNN